MNAVLSRTAAGCAVLTLSLTFAGCSGGGNMQDLHAWVARVKARPGSKIPPTPKPQQYEAFTYSVSGLRSPFIAAASPGSGVRPNPHRKKQYLEQFPLDALKFVGEIAFGGATYALIEDPDGKVSRVHKGNYMGQNNGRIMAILPDSIRLEEIVPNGRGGWQQQSASLALAQKSGG